MKYYISIEKNIEIFELYKIQWRKIEVDGIRANSMSEGIKKAIEIEKSQTDELYFIDIVADDIDFMPQLKILSEETDAPIFIATSNPNPNERKEALNNGADYYGEYCETTEQNIDIVVAAINSMERRAKKRRTASNVLGYKDLLIAPLHFAVFVGDAKVDLTSQEFSVLYILMENKGTTLTHERIYSSIYDGKYDEKSARNIIYNTIKRLRKKLWDKSNRSYIESVYDYGYTLPYDNKE